MNQKMYRFVRAHLTQDLCKVVYTNQINMNLYSFVRTALTDSDFDDSEGSCTQNSNACMANWHNPNDKLLVFSLNLSACSAPWQDEVHV